MLSISCTTPNYDLLYARYLKDPAKLLRIAEYDPKKDHMVLDLCGGTGAVSKAMIDMGAKDAILVDINPRAGFGFVAEYNGKKIYQSVAKAENFNFHEDRQFDLIVCRQAVNYLNIKKAFKNVADHLLENGRFIFNTFTTSKRFVSKEYYIKDRKYNEMSLRLFGRIFHIQKMHNSELGSQWDMTIFKYIDRDEFFDALMDAGFKSIRMIIEGNSAYYICRKDEAA